MQVDQQTYVFTIKGFRVFIHNKLCFTEHLGKITLKALPLLSFNSFLDSVEIPQTGDNLLFTPF